MYRVTAVFDACVAHQAIVFSKLIVKPDPRRAQGTLAIWLDAPEELRRERALARDGELFAPHWEQWAAQEQAHWHAGRPWELADLVIDVAAG